MYDYSLFILNLKPATWQGQKKGHLTVVYIKGLLCVYFCFYGLLFLITVTVYCHPDLLLKTSHILRFQMLYWLKVMRSDYDGFQFHLRDVYSHCWHSYTFTFISMWSVYNIKPGDNSRVAVRKKWRHCWVFGDYPYQQDTTLKDLHKLVSFYVEFMKQQM